MACKLNICLFAPLIILVSGISVDSLLQQCRPYDLKGIESGSYSSIHTMFVLVIINAMMNLKQFGLVVLICVETNWPGS